MAPRFRDIPQFTNPGPYTVDYPINRLPGFIADMTVNEGLQLNPEFQRGHVWTRRQQIAYIEFLLRGGRSGRDIYLNKPDWRHPVPDGAYNDFVCVDGLQRVTAITAFVDGNIKVFGHKFNEYEDPRELTMNTVRVHINDLQSYADVLRWYLEMNTGGTPHTHTELARVQTLLYEHLAEKE